MPIEVTLVLSVVFAFVGMILTLVFITPKSKRPTLPKFFKFLHDLFNFNFLIIEKILKALYILSTLFIFCLGFFMLFSGYQSYDFYGYGSSFQSFAGYGILIMLLGPIVIRISYEFLMLTILLVKNVIEINKRAKGEDSSYEFNVKEYATKRPVYPNQYANNSYEPQMQPQSETYAAQSEFVFCTQCGTKYDKNSGGCPNCRQ